MSSASPLVSSGLPVAATTPRGGRQITPRGGRQIFGSNGLMYVQQSSVPSSLVGTGYAARTVQYAPTVVQANAAHVSYPVVRASNFVPQANGTPLANTRPSVPQFPQMAEVSSDTTRLTTPTTLCEKPGTCRPSLKRRGTMTVTAPISFDFEEERAKDAQARDQHLFFSWLNWAPQVDSPCYNALHKWFPNALPGQALHARSSAILMEKQFTPQNTLFGTSICPDEINNEKHDLAYIMADFWGEVFPLGGISGAPFAGKTGFKAFSHHVPDNGNVLVLFGPHVAISESGEVGKYLRENQAEHSTACGAVIGSYNHCLNCEEIDDELDEHDMQMGWINKQLAPHCKHVQAQENPMATLAHQAYQMVKAKTLGVVNNDFGSGCLVLIGGIQINMPAPLDDHFLPCMFELRQAGCPTEDLLAAFEHP